MAKARDIIPGWPRGKSTSNLGPGNSSRDYMRWPSFWSVANWNIIGDPRFTEDVAGERAEEKRKRAMMEAYYADCMSCGPGETSVCNVVDGRHMVRVSLDGFTGWFGRRALLLFAERTDFSNMTIYSDRWGFVTLEGR